MHDGPFGRQPTPQAQVHTILSAAGQLRPKPTRPPFRPHTHLQQLGHALQNAGIIHRLSLAPFTPLPAAPPAATVQKITGDAEAAAGRHALQAAHVVVCGEWLGEGRP